MRLLGDKGLLRGLTTNLVGVRLPLDHTERDSGMSRRHYPRIARTSERLTFTRNRRF